MTKVPIQDLQRHTKSLVEPMMKVTRRIIKSGRYTMGEEVDRFELSFASYLGVKYCAGVANGSDALELSLRAVGVKPGDKVLTVANAGMYAANAIIATGAIPHFVDIDPVTMNMSKQSLLRTISHDHSALVVTHLYGRMADIDSICNIARDHDVKVVEDCAQSVGSYLGDKYSGTWGLVGCFSFYPTKNLGALGDAGAVVTNDRNIDKRIRALRQYGWEKKYFQTHTNGRNSRMDELQAGLLTLKLPYLENWIERRKYIVNRYRETIGNTDTKLPSDAGGADTAHLCVLQVHNRERFRKYLEDRGVATEIHYPVLDYKQSSLANDINIELRGVPLPVSEKVLGRVVTIPCFPELTEQEIAHISSVLSSWRKDN
ncbi:MAG: DegT/DnrJ/EryC1/StrS family aminotransferase [Pseudomonadota bacterium]|nr:DegT/DnrJ/EryC1/StrS family aminotransferase [Pseudomonadota bacterium]